MKSIILLACLAFASASFFSSPTIDNPEDLSGCGELLPKSFKMSYMGFTVSLPQCEDGKVKAKVQYDPGRYLPAITIMDASADIELEDNGDSVTINYENLDLGRINHHIINEIPWLNLTRGSYTYDKFSKGKDTLKLKGVLNPGDTLVSKNRLFQLEYQDDGNLVLTEAAVVNFTVWESGTSGKPGKVVLESDGNLVIYNSKDKVVWQSDTADKSVSRLLLRNDGNIILVANNEAVWQSGETEDDAVDSSCGCSDDDDNEDRDVSESKGKTNKISRQSYLDRVKSFFKAIDEDEDEDKADKENRDDDDDDDDDDDEKEEQEKKRKAKEAKEEKEKKQKKKEKDAKKAKDEENKAKKDRKKSEKEEKKMKKDRKKNEKAEKQAKKDRKKAEEDL